MSTQNNKKLTFQGSADTPQLRALKKHFVNLKFILHIIALPDIVKMQYVLSRFIMLNGGFMMPKEEISIIKSHMITCLMPVQN